MTFSESWPWKRELDACADRLRKAAQKTVDQNADSYGEDDWEVMSEEIFEVERDVMIGCFALRRLLEMPLKVTQDIRGLHVKVTAYPLLEEGAPPDVLEALNAFEFYDMKNPRTLQLHIPKMCNLFIHSHVLHFAWDLVGMTIQESYELEEDDPRIGGPVELGGFYVSTDISGEELFRVDIETLADSFEAMFHDEVRTVRIGYDSRGKRKVIEVSSNPPVFG